MIQIDIVDYDNLSSLGMRITKYVNSNLRDIVRVLIDILETDPEFDLDGFFPRDYLMRKPQECRNAVNELYEIICSKNIRDFIKPKYEYLLYAILCWWEDCTDDEDDLIINPIDDELKRDLNYDDGKNSLKLIQDFEEYYYICFQDHDFLPEQLSSMVMLYLRNPKLLEMFFQHDNLDDYIDLMECDLRDRYLETQSEKNRGYPEKPVVPFIKATQDRVVLEIQRGCIRGCRFCQAGMVYRPTRERDVEKLKELATHMLRNTGHDEISLSSLSSSDYSHLPELVNYLIDSCPEKGVNISLPSLRIDAFSLDVMSKVQDIKKSSLTFAPEAGSQRMRNVINKGLTEEVILDGAGKAFEGGWNKVKLYFMLGLPTETEDDIKGIAHLAEKIAERYYEIPKDQRNGKCQITASSSFFIPKPFTPFQWAPMNTEREFLDKAAIVKAEVRAQLNQKSIRYIYHEADISLLEGFLARGDRKCAEVIEKAYRKGAIFDAWSEYFRKDAWEEAFAETGIDVSFYACRERSTDEILPWDFLDIGVTKKFLIREWERAQKETVTPNCKMQCSGCGAKSFGGGVCYENQN